MRERTTEYDVVADRPTGAGARRTPSGPPRPAGHAPPWAPHPADDPNIEAPTDEAPTTDAFDPAGPRGGHRAPAPPPLAGGELEELARHGLRSAVDDDVARRFADDDPELAPFGLPILNEVPDLADLLTRLRRVDRLVADCLGAIIWLEDTGLAEATTGVGLDAWISLVGRRTGADTRMLRTSVAVFRRVPSLRTAFDAGQVSWAQVRSIVLMVHRLPGYLDDRIDAAVAAGVRGAGGAQPDDVTRTIRWTLRSLEATEVAEQQRAAEREEYLAIQPRLDGSGGRFWGEAGPEALAVLDAAVNGDAGAPDGAARHGVAGDRDEQAALSVTRSAGKRRLDRLVSLLDSTLRGAGGGGAGEGSTGNGSAHEGSAGEGSAGEGSAGEGSAGEGSAGEGSAHEGSAGPAAATRSRPQLILRTELSALLDREQVPAALLTTLLGGHVRVTAETARRLVEARGADLRSVILDDTGTVVGVGRRRRRAPGWLRDAQLALHDTCSEPTCSTAARVCESDHAEPWHPIRPGDTPGRTDIDQLAPLCRRSNAAKEREGWQVQQRPDGSRRWWHERSGLTTRTLPATWRPPPA